MRAGRIAIVTGATLTRNPRAAKEAMTLAGAGYEVIVFGSSDRASFENDQSFASRHGFSFESVVPVSPNRSSGDDWPKWPQVRSRLGRDAFRFLGLENHWQLGYCGPELLRASGSSNADYHIIHLEQSMWAGKVLLRDAKRVGVDMEDWYSEDLLPDGRKHRPVQMLRDLEACLLRQGMHATCPAAAMSDALAGSYACAPPIVIYNAFPWADRNTIDGATKDRRDRSLPSIHWISQTLGEGRGLEDLFAALPHVTHEAEIHLRGNPVAGFPAWMANRVTQGWRERVFVHRVVSNDELLSRIAEHDIGFAGEMKYCRNKELTVSNKILHYLLAGLAVVASDTAGQREVANQAPEAVALYPSGDAIALAARINALLDSSAAMQRAKVSALRAAERTFCWEREEGKLLDVVARALTVPVPRPQAR